MDNFFGPVSHQMNGSFSKRCAMFLPLVQFWFFLMSIHLVQLCWGAMLFAFLNPTPLECRQTRHKKRMFLRLHYEKECFLGLSTLFATLVLETHTSPSHGVQSLISWTTFSENMSTLSKITQLVIKLAIKTIQCIGQKTGFGSHNIGKVAEEEQIKRSFWFQKILWKRGRLIRPSKPPRQSRHFGKRRSRGKDKISSLRD